MRRDNNCSKNICSKPRLVPTATQLLAEYYYWCQTWVDLFKLFKHSLSILPFVNIKFPNLNSSCNYYMHSKALIKRLHGNKRACHI